MSSPLRTALRDFALIVVGVLVALYFEGWNDKRHEAHRELEYLSALIADVQTDTARFRRDVEQATLKESQGNTILEVVVDRRRMEIPSDTFFRALDAVGRCQFPPYATGTYDDLMTSGDIRLIRDGQIREMLADYYQGLAVLDRNADLFRQRLWEGYLSHVVATVPMRIQAAQVRGDSVQASERDVQMVVNGLRARPEFPSSLKGAIRTYILIQVWQENELPKALDMLSALKTEIAERSR